MMRHSNEAECARRLRPLALIALLVAVAPFALALDPKRLPTQYVHRVWSADQGLPQVTVQAIAQTPDGYLWIGTQSGLARFDGVQLTVLDSESEPAIRDSWIGAFLVRRSGALWIGTSDGIVVYENGRFRAMSGPAGLYVTALAEDAQGTVWIGTNDGALLRSDGSGFSLSSVKLSGNHVHTLKVDRDGLWVGTSGGLDRVRGTTVEHYGPMLGGASVLAIHRLPDKRLLLGTNRGLFAFDGTRMSEPSSDIPRDDVSSIESDGDGNVWIGTQQGLFRWRGGRAVPMDLDGLTNDYIEAIFEDREGNVWVGTHFGGVRQLRDGPFVTFSTREGLSHDAVWSVQEDADGVVWAGTSRGLNRFDGQRWTHVPLPIPPQTSVDCLLAEGRSELWVGTFGAGLLHLSNGRVTRIYGESDGIVTPKINALLRDRRGALWIGTEGGGGLCRLEGERMTVFRTGDGLPNENIFALYEDRRGRIWAATGGGIGYYDGSRFRTNVNATQLPRETIWGVFEDTEGDFWIAAHRGLYRLRGDSLIRFDSRHGLPVGDIGHVIESPSGVLWLSTAKGVIRVLRRDLDAVARGKAANIRPMILGVSDGMGAAECDFGVSPSVLLARDGRLWFPTVRGFAVLDPGAIRHHPSMAPFLEKVVIDAKSYSGREPLVLGPGVDRIEFHYTAPTFAAPERVRFRYRLEGFDDSWVDVGSRRVAYYTRIPPGAYRFHVESVGDDGRWVAAAASIPIELQPPFYRTAWFLTICLAAAVSLIWLVHAYRMRQLELRHSAVLEERARIAREIHDTVAQGLTGLGLQLEAAMQFLPDVDRAREQIVRAKQTAAYSLAEARRALFRLRSQELEDGDLAAAITRRAADMTAGSHVRADVRITGSIRKLRDDVATELLRIAQEAIANALRHAAATRIDILLDVAPDHVRLEVADNGHGSGPFRIDDLAAARFGVVGMRERAEKMGGRFMSKSDPAKGTEITVEVPA